MFLAERAYKDGAHVSHFVGYTLGKLGPVIYPEEVGGVRFGDIAEIQDRYRELGMGSISKSEINGMAYLAYAFSSSTWDYFKSVGSYISEGKMRREAPGGKFRIPDWNGYFTSKGLSVKLVSGYKVDEKLELPFAVEYVFRGYNATETTLGAKYQLLEDRDINILGALIIGLAPGGKIELDGLVYKNLRFMSGISFDRQKSLYGERNIVTLRHGESAQSAYTNLKLLF